MDLQRTHEPFCFPESDEAANHGSDALPEPVIGQLQQDDGGVYGAHAEEQVVDRSVLQQVAHEDGIDDGDQLVQNLLPGSGDGCRIGEVCDPDVHADQDIDGDRDQEDWEIAYRFFDVREIGDYKEADESADDRPKDDRLGKTPVRIVKDLPVSEAGEDGAGDGEERGKAAGASAPQL